MILSKKKKKTKTTGPVDLKFMGSTEDKTTCKNSVCTFKNWKQVKNCGFSRPLSKVAEAVIFGRPSRDQAEKLGFVSAGVLSFSWTSAHSCSVTKMQEHSWPIQAQLSLSQDALSPARKR